MAQKGGFWGVFFRVVRIGDEEWPLRHQRAVRRWVALVLLVGVMAGCVQHHRVEDVEPVIVLPDDWYEVSAGAGEDWGWCGDFGDPRLAHLVDRVLSQNLELGIAEVRVREARALLRQSRARRYPSVGIGAEAEVEWWATGVEQDYEISAPMSYEVDLWGRVAAEVEAAEIDLEALDHDLIALRLALAADTAEHYFELERVRAELVLLEEQIENATTFLELTELRHAQGMANAIDVVQQRQAIEELRESLVRAQLEERLVLSAVATLLGETRSEVEVQTSGMLPDAEPLKMEAVPADLLLYRPDVQAARLRVVAADYRVDAALAERLPRLELSASIGVQAANVQELFRFLFVTAAGAVSQPLFEGGRIQGRIDQQEAARERQLLEFSAVLLAAIREVEETLARGQSLQAIQETQRRQLEAAREALSLAEVQYRAGILDYLRVLTALESVQDLELAELDKRRLLLSQRIQLCRAAGGYWPWAEAQFEDGIDE